MQAAIATKALGKSFGGVNAVDGVDLLVPQGSIYGFLGPNGAGKTTTIRLLTGLLKPSSGSIAIFGLAMPSERLRVTRVMGSLVETPSLYDHLTGRENLEIARLLIGLSRATVDRALELADMRHAADRRVACYSLGMRQRLALARALLSEPRLLILDEPGNGLDPDGIRELRALLRRLSREAGVTILVSSHQLSEVQQVATHIGLMASGRLLAQGTVAEVLGGAPGRIEICSDRPVQTEAVLRALNHSPTREGDRVVISAADDGHLVSELIATLVGAGIRLSEVRCCAPTLEDLYVQLLDRTLPPFSPLARLG